MKSKSVVIFPDTVPAMQVLIPLVPVFDKVVYCQPVENDDSGGTPGRFETAMVEHSHCDFHAPAPLGENRDRFLHLVRDIDQYRDDYSSQLTHVSLAGISNAGRPAAESKSSILSSLLSRHGIDSAEQEQKEKLLWQARLVLKLGEQYDADQQNISADVHTIQEREKNLFAGMSREEDSPFSLTKKMTSLVPDGGRMQNLRLKAWSRLFAFGPSSIPEEPCFVSVDPDAVDRLSEEYARKKGSSPSLLISLDLPALYPDESKYQGQLHQFFQDEATVRENLSAFLRDPATISEKHQQIFSKQGGEWSAILERYFPEKECGRCKLELFAFSGVHVKQLFLDSFGHDEEELQAGLADDTFQDVLIGLLQRK